MKDLLNNTSVSISEVNQIKSNYNNLNDIEKAELTDYLKQNQR